MGGGQHIYVHTHTHTHTLVPDANSIRVEVAFFETRGSSSFFWRLSLQGWASGGDIYLWGPAGPQMCDLVHISL